MRKSPIFDFPVIFITVVLSGLWELFATFHFLTPDKFTTQWYFFPAIYTITAVLIFGNIFVYKFLRFLVDKINEEA